MTTSTKKSAKASVTGRVMTRVPGFVLVKVALPRKEPETLPQERASNLIPKVARALSKPGIRRDVVFKGKTKNVYSYSVDTSDTSRVVRVAADGKRTVGRLVGNKFVAVKTA